jgi:very-short-patch-repair endonuclease
MQAATLACGDGTVVSHRTAAALLGILETPPAVVDVIAPGEAGRGIDGIRRHHVPMPIGEEAGTCDGIPCTSPSRTLVDLAGTLGERSLRRVVEQAAVLRVLNIAEIDRIMQTTSRRGAPLLRRLLGDWRVQRPGSPGSNDERRLRSTLEARLLTLIATAELPAPHCNREIRANDKTLEVDFLWPEQRLVVEADGERFHDNPVAFERDRMRDRALQLAGFRVVRFTHAQIKSEPDAVVSAIRGLLSEEFG